MKLSTRIAQSRHGIYYYRHQFTVGGKRREKRFSLRTKHPAIAKNKALLVSAILVANRTGVYMSEPNDESIENILKRIDADARNLEIVYSSPDGRNVTMKADPNVPGDLDALMRASEAFWNSELGQSFKHAREAFVQNVFNGNGASLVVGLPGTGKSFAMKYAVQFARQQRYRTIGLAPTGKVASAVAADTNPDYAGTIDKFLLEVEAGRLELGPKDMVFVDEAGMVGTRHYAKLLSAVQASGAKLVLVGDNNQLDPVSAGNTFNELITRHADRSYTTILSEISRQKLEASLDIASHVSGKATMDALDSTDAQKLRQWQSLRLSGDHIKQAFAAMDDCGFVTKHRTTREMTEGAVGEFLSNVEAYTEKILLASTNKTVDHLNERIQEQRRAGGELGKAIETSKGIFHARDRIVIRKNNRDVKNGDLGTITRVTHDGLLLVEFDNGKSKTIDPEKTDMGLGYAMTIHKSQGITKNTTIHVGEVSELNNSQSFNVAATRNRFEYSFHAVEADFDAIRNSYCRSSSKMSLMDIHALLDGEQDPLRGKRERLDWINSFRVPQKLTHEDVMEVMGIDLRQIQEIATNLETVPVKDPELAALRNRMRDLREKSMPKPNLPEKNSKFERKINCA